MPENAPSDALLLGRWISHRDERAFHLLVERYAGLVHQASRRVCGDENLAAEASQLSFITLARRASSLSSRTTLAGWLHITAVMQTRNLLRQRQRENRKHELLRHHMDLQPRETPADVWSRLQPHLDEALADLSEADRETLLLRFYRSLSVKEIAGTLGIATAAAQKRLDRATVRLRRQLTRRGCTVGGSLAAAMLAGFASDAQAAVPSTTVLAGKAIAAAGTGSAATFSTLAIIAMTKKTAITTGAALLLVGAGAIVAVNRGDDSAPPSAPNSANQRPGNSASATPGEVASAASNRVREREAGRDAELIEKYGESRTNLSKHVAANVIGLLEEAVEMAEMATTGEMARAFGGRRNGLRMGLGGIYDRLELTEEQQEKAAELFADFQKREVARSKESIAELKKNPDALTRLFLAGDAFKRGEISEVEYKEIQTANASGLDGVMNPLDRENFRGGQPLADEAFNEGFAALLDTDQAATYQAAVEDHEAKAGDARRQSDITELPVMELEKLDETIVSARKLTGGLKQMMEGMGGLQDLGPMLEQQRRAREGGE